MKHVGPSLPFSDMLHAEKYRAKNESFKQAGNRIANALCDSPEHFHSFREIYYDMRFLPAGRIQSAIGSSKNTTPYNCFVSGNIEDSFVEGHGSIMSIAHESATTMRMGGGIGYNFGTLRPRGASIAKLQSSSSGPVSFMEIFNSICHCVSSSGHRRGAQMGVMPIWHPDIEEFILAKQPPQAAQPILEQLSLHEPGSAEHSRWYGALQAVYKLTGFNVSVGITDEFMIALQEGREFSLRFGGKIFRTLNPRDLMSLIMQSTWDWAEPGVLFLDTINKMNNLYYCQEIFASNPCGEQPLPSHGACLLGSFNLVRYIRKNAAGGYYFDWDLFIADIRHVVRAMDNVVDRAIYPLYAQEKEAKSKRRMGLGVTGLSNAAEALGHRYGDAGFVNFERMVLTVLRDECYMASVELAKEKGAFPMFDRDLYLKSKFIKTLPEEIQECITRFGIRNSHLTSIAPTGTISMTADNVSSGIEPVFAIEQRRVVNMPAGQIETDFDDYGYRVFGVRGKTANQVTAAEHLEVLATAAALVDSAVSKTCNVPPTMPFSDFNKLYVSAWERGCKGITTFQSGGKRAGILKSLDKEEAEEPEAACRIDVATGRRECE